MVKEQRKFLLHAELCESHHYYLLGQNIKTEQNIQFDNDHGRSFLIRREDRIFVSHNKTEPKKQPVLAVTHVQSTTMEGEVRIQDEETVAGLISAQIITRVERYRRNNYKWWQIRKSGSNINPSTKVECTVGNHHNVIRWSMGKRSRGDGRNPRPSGGRHVEMYTPSGLCTIA